ncbi:MAG: Rieske 2Fe-2S domain-containing protein [Pigmentiphaga sp.]
MLREDAAGSGYERAPGHFDEYLVRVGRGTPCGELMRRYWQPVGVSETLGSTPRRVRILDEDLILFRDGQGRAGLFHERCCHRGTSLYFGRVEDEGLRCCYHGWLFDVRGRCLEQPCEPEGGRARDKVRQPWYPVEERYGLVFAYLGPLDSMSPLPRYDILENLAPGERLVVEGSTFYVGGPHNEDNPHAPYSWLQNWENVVDSYHVVVLHSTLSGTQFRREFEVMPKVEWVKMDHGIAALSRRPLPDGREFYRVTQTLLPNIRIVPTIELREGLGREIAWLVPVGDDSHRTFGVAVVQEGEESPFTRRSRIANFNGKIWTEMTEEEHRDFPGDYEAQYSQGPITLHSEEHLATSDRGLMMLRRLLRRQIETVEKGGHPLGAGPSPESVEVRIQAGNFFPEPTGTGEQAQA